jgi:hypothetical protein
VSASAEHAAANGRDGWHLHRLERAKAPVVLRGEEAELCGSQAAKHCRVAAAAEVRTFGADENRAEVVVPSAAALMARCRLV